MQTAISPADSSSDDLTIKIPLDLAHKVGLQAGMQVELQILDNKLIIVPLTQQFSLAELLADITPENIHQPSNTGSPVGKEAW